MSVGTTFPPTAPTRRPPVEPWRRVLAVLAGLAIAVSFLFPLWGMRMVAPQYPEGLQLNVYAYKMAGGGTSPHVDELAEINTLNHYIGMAELHEDNFTELKVLPIGIGLAALLALLGVTGRRRFLVASLAVLSVVGVGGLVSAFNRLYQYGHNLDPMAPVKVAPFTPVFVGTKQIANFTTIGAFGPGAYCLLLGAILAAVAWLWPRKRQAV